MIPDPSDLLREARPIVATADDATKYLRNAERVRPAPVARLVPAVCAIARYRAFIELGARERRRADDQERKAIRISIDGPADPRGRYHSRDR